LECSVNYTFQYCIWSVLAYKRFLIMESWSDIIKILGGDYYKDS
jgi:hypothetical protein